MTYSLKKLVTDTEMAQIMEDVYNDYQNNALDDLIAMSIIRNLFTDI